MQDWDPAQARKQFRAALADTPTFTATQAGLALLKHGLGRIDQWEPIQTGMVNTVGRATSAAGTFYIKIQFRPGFPAASQAEASEILRRATALPLSERFLVDESGEAFGFPYTICDALPGTPTRQVFEAANDVVRQRILTQFGRVTATIHRASVPQHRLPCRCLADWKEHIRTELLSDEGLPSALPPAAQEHLRQIASLLPEAVVNVPPTASGLLWGDATLHNLLVDTRGYVTGVIDLENAAWGDLLHDQLFIEADFEFRHPRELYGRPDLRDAFWAGYVDAGGTRLEASEQYLELRCAMQVTALAWFWRVAHVVHPDTPAALTALERFLGARTERYQPQPTVLARGG